MNDSIDRQFAQITERGLDQLRERIGVRIENSLEPWCHEATRDNIRHYAHGIGDDNPLWCDPDYAAKTQYGGIIALPLMIWLITIAEASLGQTISSGIPGKE